MCLFTATECECFTLTLNSNKEKEEKTSKENNVAGTFVTFLPSFTSTAHCLRSQFYSRKLLHTHREWVRKMICLRNFLLVSRLNWQLPNDDDGKLFFFFLQIKNKQQWWLHWNKKEKKWRKILSFAPSWHTPNEVLRLTA